MNPKYPIYIVSKGRWKTRLTSKALERICVPYWIVVEEPELNEYASVIDPSKILVLPKEYLQNYETCDDAPETKGKGPGAARNFCWQHSIEQKAYRHWVMDDNIASFNRLNRNLMVKVASGTIFKAAEDFADRYENIAIAGFNYDFFAKAKDRLPAFVMNTRIYSCLLIKNDLQIRWRGRYNEDTDLSLRSLKAGLCTIQFNAFLQEKTTTQMMSGGNTDEFYSREGTLPKSQMLERMHPDVAKVVWRFNRWHHKVNYKPFKRNRLKLKEGLEIPDEVNNYGMRLTASNKTKEEPKDSTCLNKSST
jgi:hypothetical protein